MDNSTQNLSLVGLFIKRKNIPNPIIKDIHKELLIYLFEAQILLLSFFHLKNKNLYVFDGNVGDAKCQTRASILINMYTQDNARFAEKIFIKQNLESLVQKIKNLLAENDFKNHLFVKNNVHVFKFKNMNNFIEKYQLNILLPKEIIIPALCMITKLSRTEIHALTENEISKQSIDKLQELAKIQLCQLSIQYENSLISCPLSEEKKSLTQIESKKYSSDFLKMTSFFLGFKPIFQKMKINNEFFIQKIIYFCTCNGIINQTLHLYRSEKNIFKEIDISLIDKNKVIMVIEGLSYSGSFNNLKNNLLIPLNKRSIPNEYQTPCKCSLVKNKKFKNNIEEIILANFAQHPQFITGAEINWKDLGLTNSNLKKEFDHLKTISGCSNDDMSQFCILHVYASTIADVLKEQEEMEARLQAK